MAIPTAAEARAQIETWTIAATPLALFVETKIQEMIRNGFSTITIAPWEVPGGTPPAEHVAIGIGVLEGLGYGAVSNLDGSVTISVP